MIAHCQFVPFAGLGFAFVFVARCKRRLADSVHFYTLGRGRWSFGTGRSVGLVDARAETVVGNLWTGVNRMLGVSESPKQSSIV